MTPNIADIIRQHVTLSISCIDRLYLHAYMPKLQTSGGLCYFLHDHLGNPIPSPALFRPIHDRFLTAVEAFASQHRIPTVEFRLVCGKTTWWRTIARDSHAARGSSCWGRRRRRCAPSRHTNAGPRKAV